MTTFNQPERNRPMIYDDHEELGTVRERLLTHASEGTDCPLCTQRVKIYPRKLNSTKAWCLIRLYRTAGQDWLHVPTFLPDVMTHGGELAKNRYWSLVEESRERREDGGRAGYWRVTDNGRLFIKGEITVPEIALTFNGRLLGLRGGQIRITDALGSRFDLRELLTQPVDSMGGALL